MACLCLAAIAFFIIAAPVDLVRDRLVEQVKARTGRDLVIAGPTALSFFPRPAVSLRDVSLSAPEGINAPPTLTVPAVEAELRLWSLLTARPAIERVVLHRPVIELSVDAQGRRSWKSPRRRTPSSAANVAATQQPPTEPVASNEPRRETTAPRFGLGSIVITDGTVRYNNHGAGTQSAIESLNLTLTTADDPTGPLTINGTLAVRGAPLTIAGTISSMRKLLSDQPAQLTFKVSGPPVDGAYEGAVSLAGGISLDGALNLRAASARALGDWLGRPLPASETQDTVALSTEVKTTPNQVSLSNLRANVGPATMVGSLMLETGQQKRHLTGSLQFSELDFAKLLLMPGRGRAAAPSRERAAAPAPATPPAPAVPPAPGVPPAPAAKHDAERGWRDDPVNLANLRLLDANLTVSAGHLIHKEIKTGPARFTVGLEGGVARVALEEVAFYGGRVRGLLTLDGSGDVLVASNNLILNRVAFRPLLTDVLQFPWLEGNGNIYLELTGRGLTERQIVESLNGKAEMTSTDGAITGLDVGKIVRSLQRARLPNFTPSPEEKTPFSEFSANFTVTNGVAKNQDLKLVSTHVQLSGEGTLELGPRQIDYTLRTKIGGTPEPDATIKVGTLEVPISITGPWERPAFGIKGQEQFTGTLKQIRKNFKSQEVQDAIKGLLQGDGEKRVKPRDLIDKLLKKD